MGPEAAAATGGLRGVLRQRRGPVVEEGRAGQRCRLRRITKVSCVVGDWVCVTVWPVTVAMRRGLEVGEKR